MLSALDLTGRVAVVVGGTSGLGRAIALGLAEAGADVVASGRREALVQEACDQIKHIGRRSLPLTVDVLRRDSVDSLRDGVLESFGRADILVNAAGVVARKPTTELTEAEWQATMDVNTTGALRTCQSFFPSLSA